MILWGYMMAKLGPCKGCKDREVGCHAGCKKYKEWLDEFHAEKDADFRRKHPLYWQYVNGKRGR